MLPSSPDSSVLTREGTYHEWARGDKMDRSGGLDNKSKRVGLTHKHLYVSLKINANDHCSYLKNSIITKII